MTKRERIEELERRVAELEARPTTEHHYHYERPVLGSGWRCPSCGVCYAIGSYHACWTVPYWNPPSYGPIWGGVLTNTTSGYAAVEEASAIVYSAGGLE